MSLMIVAFVFWGSTLLAFNIMLMLAALGVVITNKVAAWKR